MANKRKIIIWTGATLAVAGIGYLLYKRNVNKRNSMLLNDYISTLPKENTAGAVNAMANQAVQTAQTSTGAYSSIVDYFKKNPTKKIIFDFKGYDLTNKSSRDTAFKIANDIATALRSSMSGAGTNMTTFTKTFKRINSNGAFILVNDFYKGTYKTDLWKDIEGEESLYSGAGNGYNAILKTFTDLPNYNPVISTVVKYWKD